MPDLRPSPSEKVSKLVTRMRGRGPGEVIPLGMHRVREAYSSEEELIVMARPTGGPPPTSTDFIFREGGSADGTGYARDISTDSPSTFRNRLSDQTRCFLVIAGDRFVHATWMTTAAAWTREVRAYFCPPREEAYIYESFTRADARGRGVYPFALAGIASRLAEIAIERVWVAVEAHNAPSLRAVGKAGFREVERVRYSRRFGLLRVDGPRCPDMDPRSLCLSSTPGRVAR